MKSVLIINSEIYDEYQKYAFFFDWFEAHGDISICIWEKFTSDEAGIDELVPQLFDIVKNETEWNVYIVDEPLDSGKFINDDLTDLTQYSVNPYERDKKSDCYNPNKDSLMRLIYYLGGRDTEIPEYDGRYAFKAVRPTQIYLLTPRAFDELDWYKEQLQSKIEDRERKSSTDAIAMLTVMQSSQFWARYDYPSNCRFLVIDMPDVTSVQHESSWFLVWISVLMLVLNTFTNDEIVSYKLNRIKIDISAEELGLFLNRYYSVLYSKHDSIQREIEKEINAVKEAMRDTTSNYPKESALINVEFPNTDISKFQIQDSLFGDTKDKPGPKLDTDVWKKHRDDFNTEEHKLYKAITRGKNEAAENAKYTFAIDLPLLKEQHLTRYDVEDISDDINNNEMEMLALNAKEIVSHADFEKKLKNVADKIESVIQGRILKKTYIKLMAVGTMICLMGFIPFIISSAKFNMTSTLISIVITILSGVVVASGSFVGLKILRWKLSELFKKYNDVVSARTDVIRDNARIQSEYLTRLLNNMEKHQLLQFSKIDDRHTKRLEELTRHQAVYDEAISQCKSIAGLCSVSLSVEEDYINEMVLFDNGEKIYLHDDIEGMMITFNDIPDRLIPPFSFVGTMLIDEENLYESSKYYKGA